MSIALRLGFFQVLPSGMFQAPFREYNIEFSILHSLLWEYYEEFFSAKDPTEKRMSPKWFYSEQEVAELHDMISNHSARLYSLGVAVDLLNLRPEILLLLYIKDRDWFHNHATGNNNSKRFVFNTEHATSDELPSGKEPVLKVRFKSDVSTVFEMHGLIPGNTVPCTAAALSLGIQSIEKLQSRS